ncbi:MAG TPA: hypothetical protein VHB49_03045 [Bradyrhizobium sp.]|nr:hypothetical protein [Bradyrhizobium sp.]
MNIKHAKQKQPSDLDLTRNPLIGGSKGAQMAQAAPDELEEFQGENTFEGDVYNDTNPEGGIEDAAEHRSGARRGQNRATSSRKTALQGKKTHEQQLRILERKPDMPDERRIDQNIGRLERDHFAGSPRQQARQSEFPVSRGGLNQESQHNKHNYQTQSGHKPQKSRVTGNR